MASPLAYTNLPDEGGVTYTNTQPTFKQLDAVTGRGNIMGRGALAALYGVAAGRQASDAMAAELAGDEARKKSALRAHNELAARAAYEAPNQDIRKIGGVGDAIDFARGAMGNAAVTMLPSIAGAALFRGRGPIGKATAFGGAYAPAYVMERDEALSSQYQDPEQMKASAQERDLAATAKGGINAALESIVPAGLGRSLLRKPAGSLLGHIGREAVTEGLTEGAQQLVGYGAQKYVDSNKELDPWDVANAVAAGAAGGGGMSAVMRGPAHAAQAILDKAPKPQMPEIKNPFQRGDETGGVVDLPEDPSGGGSGPADTMLGKVAGLGAAVQDRFGDDIAAAGGKAKDMAGKAKDIVSDTLDRMTEAVDTSANPGEFLNKVFGSNIDEEAAADLSGEPNPMLKGITFEETGANIARDDEQRVARAARYADELLNDPATPDAVKQRVVDMGGDFTNPDNREFVARTLVSQRAGEKTAKAVQDLIDLGKSAFTKGSEAASAAKKAVGDAATAAQDRIVKKNLQSASPAEQAAFGKVIFDGLTDEAKANPLVRAQLAQVTNAIMAFAAKTGDITAKDLPTLTKLSNAMSLFKDPDAMAAQLVEYGAIPRTEDSFLSRIKRIQNAQQDLKQPNSFLVSSLTPEATKKLTGPMLQRLAQFVDEFSLQDAAGKGDQILEGLTQAFGSKENAQVVLDFYAQQNKANVRFDPNEGEDARPRSSDDIGDADDIEGFGTLSEQDAKELVPRFRHPNINRPFFRGRDDAASDAELARGGDLAQRVSMAEYVRSSNESAVFFAGDMRRDLLKRLNNNLSRDAESVREAIKMLEAHIEDAPSNGEWAGYSEAVALRNKLRGTKTEDRSAVVKLQREELKAIDSAIEKAKRAGKDPDEAVLELYDVVMAMPDQFRASDHQLTGFRKLLGKTSKRKTKAENEAIRKTGVKFLINGQEVAVSLESMVTESPIRGSVRERLLESLALVGARADEMPKIPNDAIVKRNYFGDGRHLTWGRLMGMGANPDVKSKARKEFETDPAKEAIKAELDKVNASSLREYMDNLPKDVDALSAGAGLLSRIEGQIEAAKGQMEENPSKAVGDRIRNLSSKRRVLKTYLNEILDADYPVSREAIMDNLESELQAGGIVNKEGQKTEYANILFKEELIQTYRDRADAVKGTSLADDALAKADELAVELDKDLAKLQDFQRMDLMDRPSGREPAGKRNGSTSDTRARLKRVEESLAATDGRVKDRDALEQLRGDLKAETEGAEPIHALDRMVDDGSTRAPKTGTGKNAPPGKLEALLKAGAAVLRNGVYFISDANATKYLAGTDKHDRIYVNMGKLRESPNALVDYLSSSESKQKMLELLGVSAEQLQEALGNTKRIASFLRDHERSHVDNNDRGVYPKGDDGKLDIDHPTSIAIEARATYDALTESEREKLGITARPKAPAKPAPIRPKTEPDTARQSTMNPKRGRPGKIDRQAVIDEIIRTRGKDVKVAVDKLHSALGGSGQYTYDRKTGRRLIEVAIDAIDPIGTARHEAMHDFFQFLGENEATRAVARTLKEVMGSKEVMDKLKDLLQGHKDALEQLNDPEERVAYAYQFWAAGALDLGPKSTGIFRTITNFLRDMFGIVTKEQRALDILNAFHDGDFSNVSTVREALFDQAERDGATFWEKMDRMAPALNKAVLAMSSAAPDRLRRFENDSLNALADKFFTDGGKQGFIQNRFQQEGIWSNKLEAAFAGSTAEERRIALEQLQSMKPVSPLAKKLAEFNSEMYDYMSAAGVKTFDRAQKKWVPLRRVNNYFARSWDGDAIARNRSDFVQLLVSEGDLSLGAAEKVTDKLINGREERLTPQEQSVLGFTPYAVHTAERVFGFIKPGNADEFAKFQKKDIADIMSNYVQQAVYRAEYARSFDNDGRVISALIYLSGITDKDELTAISNTVQAMEGSLDPGKWSSSTKELMSVMMTAQNVILLPLAIVSQVVDPIVLAARTGDLRDAGTAYVNGIKRLWNTVSKNGNKVDGEDLAHILGIVSEGSTLQAMGMTASTTRMSKRMEVINRKFFRYNGMQGWNNTMRITATAAAERYIIANKDNAEALAELGIAPGDVKMSTTYVPDGKGKLVAKHSLDVSSREVQQAMFKMVDQSVLRPSAANRPVWMSDPRFLLVGHLKQFTFAMHNVVLKRANKQLENGNAKPWLILALAAPAVLAADMAKFALTGGMPTSWGFFDYLSHAVNRSGLLGIGDFSTEVFSGVGQGKLPGEGLLGPSFEHVAEILRWIGGDPRTGFEDVVDRTIPFAKYV